MNNPTTNVNQNDPLAQLKKAVDLRKAEAEAKKAVADAEKATLEASQAKLKATLPSGQSKPIEGTITSDEKFGYIAELAAVYALNKKAQEIAKHIAQVIKPSHGKILIVDSLECCVADVALQQVTVQLGQFKTELARQRTENEGLLNTPIAQRQAAVVSLATALAFASGTLSAAADIAGFFRADYDLKGRDVTLTDTALRASMAGYLKKEQCTVYLHHFHRLKRSPLIDKFGDCFEEHRALKLSQAVLKSQIIDPLAGQTSPQKSKAEQAFTQSETLLADFDTFNKMLTTVPEGQRYSLLVRVALQEWMDTESITHLLYLSVTSSGGDTITRRGFWKSRVAFLGGAALTYVLVDKGKGDIITAATEAGWARVEHKLGDEWSEQKQFFYQSLPQ